VGRVAFKKGGDPLGWQPCLSTPLMHRVLPPSEPPDGERPRCFRLAIVGGTQLRGSWYLSAIARLQGFSSGSPVASPRRWSPKTVTTSLLVGRSKPGRGLCPALSFKDLHHPFWGGGRAEPELYLPHGFVGHLLLQHSGERALTSLAEGADFDNAGPIGRKRRHLQRARFAGSAGSSAASGATSHRWAECGYLPAVRAVVAPRAPGDRTRRRALLGRRSCSWDVLPLLRYDASTRRSVLARPGGPEWGSAGGQMAAVVGAEVVAAEEVLVADKVAATICAPGLRLFGFDSLSSPLEWGCGQGPYRSSVCPEVIAAAVWPPGAEVVVAAAGVGGGEPPRILSSRRPSNVGGCSYLRGWNRSSICNGTLSVGVCSLWLSGPERVCIWA
jgi:hypothetical protein